MGWKLVRAPVLWCIGIVYEGYLVWELGVYYASTSSQATATEHSTLLTPFLLGGSLLLAIAFTFGCMILFLYDMYYEFMDTKSVRSIVSTAAEYSLDDVLSIVCDPTQLATWITAVWVIPTTLYALPTSVRERSRVLRAAGFIPTTTEPTEHANETDILIKPGAWKALLPRRLQRAVSEILHSTNDGSSTPEMVEVSMERMSDDGQDEPPDYCPYSISPIYNRKEKQLPIEEDVGVELPIVQEEEAPLASVEVELYQVFTASVQKILNEKLTEVYQETQKLPLLTVAIASLGIFAVHQRNSANARSMLQKIVELGFMAGSSSTAVASILGLVLPLVQGLQSPQQQQQQSLLQRICGLAAGLGLVRSTVPSSLSDIVSKRIPWKGTIAALVLFYFRRRFVASRKRGSMPKGFS